MSAVPCICQPGNLLLAGGINEADKLEVPYRDTVSVSASPHSRVKKIRFFFKLENFVPVVLCSGTLSGVSSSIFCATGACSDASANVRFAVSPAEGEYDFSADVSVLDLARPEEAGRTHLLDLTLQGEDGTLYPVILDLTDTIARLIGESGGTVPVEIPLDITLALIDNTLHSQHHTDRKGSGTFDCERVAGDERPQRRERGRPPPRQRASAQAQLHREQPPEPGEAHCDPAEQLQLRRLPDRALLRLHGRRGRARHRLLLRDPGMQ